MTQRGPSNLLAIVALTLVTELTLSLTLTAPAVAQFKPPNLGIPRTTAGGASRSGTCLTEKTALTALVPDTPGRMSLTTQDRPTFFLYLPKTNAQLAEFTIKDVTEKDVFRTTIPISGKSGLLSFQLPNTAPPLEVGKDYQWFFNVICQPSDRLRDAFITAWVRRVNPDQSLTNALKAAAPRQRPNVYAQAGIWQDTLAALTELRQSRPTDTTLNGEWNSLLRSVGLSEISQVAGGPPVGQLTMGTITTPRRP
jgi:hypothetical protein